ncbi:hypothetical protein ACQ4LE_010089 [Meloidogyne hapla]
MIKHTVSTVITVVSICFTLMDGRVIWPAKEQKEISLEISPSYYDGPKASSPFELFEIIDVDNDGQLGFEEAADWFSKMKNQAKESTLGDVEFRMIFDEADKNSDGFIQLDELEKVLKLAFENEGDESKESDEEDKKLEDSKPSSDNDLKTPPKSKEVSSTKDEPISKPTKLFEIINTNKDGHITFLEAAEWFSKKNNQSIEITRSDKEFHNLFSETDTNADGYIQPAELAHVENLAKSLAANFLFKKSLIDTSEVKKLENQPKDLSPPYYDGPTASNPKQLFKTIDTNKDVKISLEEAADWYSKMKNQSKDKTLGDEEFHMLFNEADKNKDGFIQFEELESVLKIVLGDDDESDEDDNKDVVESKEKASTDKNEGKDANNCYSGESCYKLLQKSDNENKENVPTASKDEKTSADKGSDNVSPVEKTVDESKEKAKENVPADNKDEKVSADKGSDNISPVERTAEESKEKSDTQNSIATDKVENKEKISNNEIKEEPTDEVVNKNNDSIDKEDDSSKNDDLNTSSGSKESAANEKVNDNADNVENPSDKEDAKDDKNKEDGSENTKDNVAVNEVTEDKEVHDNKKDSTVNVNDNSTNENASVKDEDVATTVDAKENVETDNVKATSDNEIAATDNGKEKDSNDNGIDKASTDDLAKKNVGDSVEENEKDDKNDVNEATDIKKETDGNDNVDDKEKTDDKEKAEDKEKTEGNDQETSGNAEANDNTDHSSMFKDLASAEGGIENDSNDKDDVNAEDKENVGNGKEDASIDKAALEDDKKNEEGKEDASNQ